MIIPAWIATITTNTAITTITTNTVVTDASTTITIK
jgi:hypothetical protein